MTARDGFGQTFSTTNADARNYGSAHHCSHIVPEVVLQTV